MEEQRKQTKEKMKAWLKNKQMEEEKNLINILKNFF